MLTLGPIQLEAWHLLLIGLGVVVLIWFLWGFLVPVTGTWERVDEDVKAGTVERITLVQFGPFIRGRRMMKGGFQEFSGTLRGRSISLNRRDHGLEMIVGQGFPPGIATELNGSVTARLRMNLSADGEVIFGTFTPQKIEFVHHPPEITSRKFLDPTFRRYRRVSKSPLETEVVDPALAKSSRKVRKTV